MMSGAFVSTNKSVRIVAGAMLTFITILSINPVRMSDYLLIRNLGLMSTVFAIIFTTSFSAVAVWAMISILRNPKTNGKIYIYCYDRTIFNSNCYYIWKQHTSDDLYKYHSKISSYDLSGDTHQHAVNN